MKKGGLSVFRVAEPLGTLGGGNTAKLGPVLNPGVKLADVDTRLTESMKKNRARRKRSAVRTRQTMKY